jgi:hypothetical protein
MSLSSSYIQPTPPNEPITSSSADEDDEDVDSLPSSTDSSEEEESDAERQWIESLQQLELLLTMVVVPYIGKYFGRKCAYWSETKSISTDDRRQCADPWALHRLGKVDGVEISG